MVALPEMINEETLESSNQRWWYRWWITTCLL